MNRRFFMKTMSMGAASLSAVSYFDMAPSWRRNRLGLWVQERVYVDPWCDEDRVFIIDRRDFDIANAYAAYDKDKNLRRVAREFGHCDVFVSPARYKMLMKELG